MKMLLDGEQMRQCDANTIEGYGVPSAVLMERAALAAAEEAMRLCPDTESAVLIACGTGNNGGDGIAMARLLYLKGYKVCIFLPGEEEKMSRDAALQLDIARRYGICVRGELPDEEYELVADALFGIGLSRELKEPWDGYIRALNEKKGRKLAIDISSGVSAGNGDILGVAFRAEKTVTFGFAKVGQVVYPGAEYSGEVIVRDIGIDEHSLGVIAPQAFAPERCDLFMLPPRGARTHKGSYGKAALFAGSVGMAGAAALAARAAYASGAGLVRICTLRENREILQTLVPEATLALYDENTDPEKYVESQLDWADVVAAGPGMGTGSVAESMICALLERVNCPTVLDADAINILAGHTKLTERLGESCIVTPHPGEMSVLSKKSAEKIAASMIKTARECAERTRAITVLKDARTVTALPDGRIYINTSGNDGMATAGSGDVLSGIIVSLLAQGADAEWAAILGVMIHGMAGDAASAVTGKRGLTATDIIDGLRTVLSD